MVGAENDVYWIAHILVLFEVSFPRCNKCSEEYDFVQYFDISEPVNKVDLLLNGRRLQWPIENGKNHSAEFDLISGMMSKFVNGMVWCHYHQ